MSAVEDRQFAICKTRKYKYEAQWNWEETKQWMRESKNNLIQQFKTVKETYKKYNREEFAKLEELIAINIGDISSEFADRAVHGWNLLRFFTSEVRHRAMNIRYKLQEVSGKHKEYVEVQVIPIILRMDKDLSKKRRPKSPGKRLANKNSGKTCVFRIKVSEDCVKFVDCEEREYDTWEKYLDENKLPQCIMCYPEGGVLKKFDEQTKKFVLSTVQFCEASSCQLINRATAVFDKVVMVSTPFIAIASLLCPATWGLTASILGGVSYGLFSYGTASQGLLFWDQCKHGQDWGAALMNCATSLLTFCITKGLSLRLRSVAAAKRALETMENIIINCAIWGLKGSQILSFAWMTFSIATKPRIEPLDVIGFVVACHNIYSCIVSPSSAKKMLEQVKAQIQAENLASIEKNMTEMDKEKMKLAENIQKLENAKSSGTATDCIEKSIKEGQAKMLKLNAEVRKCGNEYIGNVEGWMEDEGAKEVFQKYTARLREMNSAKNPIEQNKEIIKEVQTRNEQFFGDAYQNRTKIVMPDGETLDLNKTSSQTQLQVITTEVAVIKSEIAGTTSGNEVTTTASSSSTENKKPMCDQVKDWGTAIGVVSLVVVPIIKDINHCESGLFGALIGNLRNRGNINDPNEAAPAPANNEFMPLGQDNTTTPAVPSGSPAPNVANTTSQETPANVDKSLQLANILAKDYDNRSNVVIHAWKEIVKIELREYKNPPETRERKTEYHAQLREWEIAGLIQENVSLVEAETRAARNFELRENIEDGVNGAEEADIDHTVDKYHVRNFHAWNALERSDDSFFSSLLKKEAYDSFKERLFTAVSENQTQAGNEATRWSNPVSAYFMARQGSSNQPTSAPVIFDDGGDLSEAPTSSYEAALERGPTAPG